MGFTKTARIPARLAPQISVKIWSPTMMAASGGMPVSSSARRKPEIPGFPAWRTQGMSSAAQKSGQRRLLRLLETTKSRMSAASKASFHLRRAGEGRRSS